MNNLLKEEAKTWCIDDPIKRHEKIQRERIRHYKLIKDLLLDKLDTEQMRVLEIGGGPVPVIDLIPAAGRLVIDPLTEEYKKYFPCNAHLQSSGETFISDYPFMKNSYDLVVCTNALDHVAHPKTVALNIAEALKPGGFFAILCAENNAITNPHPAHQWNLTSGLIHTWLDKDFETVWELNYRNDGYRYGWVSYNGRRGQPAFAILMRKCTGYE